MVRISYRDLAPGLYAQAQAEGRHTVIYMLPGLTAAQRRSALRRLRHGARTGHCPPLPLPALALAGAVDWIRATTRNCAAVVRVHPAGSALPVMALSAATVMYILLSSVSVHMLRVPQALGRRQGSSQGQAVLPSPGHGTWEGNPPQGTSGPPGTSGASRVPGSKGISTLGAHRAFSSLTGLPARGSGQAGSSAAPAWGGLSAPSAQPPRSPSPTASPSPSASDPSSAASPSPSASDPSSAASPSPSASVVTSVGDPSPAPSHASHSPGRRGGLCLDVWSFAVCLALP